MAVDVCEWSLEGALDELAHLQDAMGERGFAFVLGAGASVSSGVAAAGALAGQWLQELHRQECRDGRSLAQWLAAADCPLPGVSASDPAAHYAAILARRFRDDAEAGYALLDQLQAAATPSTGYRWLAAILQHSRHRLAITCNFDNLVADALVLNGALPPLVLAHESLAGHARPGLSRPLLARIQHDPLAAAPQAQAGWLAALRRLFGHYTPVFIGYGGNDACLSSLLASLQPGDICGRPLWCYQDSPPPPALCEWLARHRGILLRIDDFDSFMAHLATRLLKNVAAMQAGMPLALPPGRPALPAATPPAAPQSSAEPAPETVNAAMADWQDWVQVARHRSSADEQMLIYQQALQLHPHSGGLIVAYADFLAGQGAEPRQLEQLYRHALTLEPDSAAICAACADFLAAQGDPEEAVALYRQALQLAPQDAGIAVRCADFLASRLGDQAQAATLYAHALTLAPADASLLARHAAFLAALGDVDAAEAQYRRALSLDESNPQLLGAYAGFLGQTGRELETADALFRQACHLAPQDAGLLAAHAALCRDRLQEWGAAAALYYQALHLHPGDLQLRVNLAGALLGQLEQEPLVEAAGLLEQAMELGLRRGAPGQPLAETLLYALLLDELLEGKCNMTLVACLKGLLLLDYPRSGQGADSLLQRVLPAIDRTRHAFYVALARAVADAESLVAVRRFDRWRKVEAIDPFAAQAVQ